MSRKKRKSEEFFSSSFAIDDSLCTHNPIHSFTLSGHFTKSEKKKRIDCPEKTGYWLDVQYTELCKMATAEMKSLLIFSLAEPNRCTYCWLCHINTLHTALAHLIYSRHFNVAHCGEDTALFNLSFSCYWFGFCVNK